MNTNSLSKNKKSTILLEKKWEYNKDVCQLFIDFEKAYDSIKREALYDILIKFGVPKKLDHSRHVSMELRVKLE